MYLDLRDWNKAKEMVEAAPLTELDLKEDDSVSMLSLLLRQAEVPAMQLLGWEWGCVCGCAALGLCCCVLMRWDEKGWDLM